MRVLVVSLPGSKASAVFITTLLERRTYPPRALRNLYHRRWDEEEFFKTIKEHLRAEDFRGKSVQFIDQELLSTYLYYLLTKIMMLESARLHDVPVQDLGTKAALVGLARYLAGYLWLRPLNKVKGLSSSVWLKFLGEDIIPDLVVNSPVNPKAVMANGPTNGIMSTPLGVNPFS